MGKIEKDLKAMEQEIINSQNNNANPNNNEKTKNVMMQNESGSSSNELLQFFVGFLLFGGGIYWILNSFTVSSSWGRGYWSFFGTQMPMGVMLIPLLVGIGLLFFLDRKIIGGAVSCLGLLVIVISLLSSISFHAVSGSLYVYILMFGMVAAGGALLLKSLFKKRK